MSVDGCWIVCRTCRFPVRLPRELLITVSLAFQPYLVLGCPLCGHVYKYRTSNFERVRFRAPDPFLSGHAVLYSVNFPCAVSACNTREEVLTVGAEDVSVASLLNFWKHWTMHVRCPERHLLKSPPLVYWEIFRVSNRVPASA